MAGDELNWKQVFKKILLKDDNVITTDNSTSSCENTIEYTSQDKMTLGQSRPFFDNSKLKSTLIEESFKEEHKDVPQFNATIQGCNNSQSKFPAFAKNPPKWRNVSKRIVNANHSGKSTAESSETRFCYYQDSKRNNNQSNFPELDKTPPEWNSVFKRILDSNHSGKTTTESSDISSSYNLDSRDFSQHHQVYHDKKLHSISQKTSQTHNSKKNYCPDHQMRFKEFGSQSLETRQTDCSPKKETKQIKQLRKLLSLSATFKEPETKYNLNDFDGAGVNVYKHQDVKHKHYAAKKDSGLHFEVDVPLTGAIAVKPYTTKDMIAADNIPISEYWDDHLYYD